MHVKFSILLSKSQRCANLKYCNTKYTISLQLLCQFAVFKNKKMHKIKFVAVTQLTTLVGLHVSDETKMAINCNFQVTGKVTEGSHLIFWRLSRISCPLSSAVLSGTRQTNLLRHKHGSRSMSQGASYYSRRLNQLVSSGSPEQANSGDGENR